MAVNPITGIDVDADRFVKIFIPNLATFDIDDASTFNVIDWNYKWPRFDGGPITSPKADQKHFKKLPTDEIEVDHRYSKNTAQVMQFSDPLPPAGHPDGTFQEVETPVKRPLETLLAQIETAFQQQVRTQFPDSENQTTMMLVDAATLKKQSGGVLTEVEQMLVDNYMIVVGKIQQLAERRDAMIAAATADEDYNIELWPVLV